METKNYITYKIETEDRYGQFSEYDLQAESLEAATATAEKRVNLPNGAFVTSVEEVSNHHAIFGHIIAIAEGNMRADWVREGAAKEAA
jgi:hypothetical protein